MVGFSPTRARKAVSELMALPEWDGGMWGTRFCPHCRCYLTLNEDGSCPRCRSCIENHPTLGQIAKSFFKGLFK